MRRSIYFDYNATTPLDAGVRAAMLPFLEECWGNPSSIHHVGQRARAALDDFRDRVAKLFSAKPSEIVFTSGGTESNNIAILGTARLLRDKGRHLITSAVEHHAVLHAFEYLARKEGFELTVLPVDSEGRVNPDDLKRSLRKDTVLVSVQAANNEIGTIQPVPALGAVCRDHGVVFHTDAVQWFGKLPVPSLDCFNADLVSVCAHKFHGPKGVGFLHIRSPLLPDPVFFGGAHENERRPGTENLAAIAGLVCALDSFIHKPVFVQSPLLEMKHRLLAAAASIHGVCIVCPGTHSLSNTLSFTVQKTDSITLMANLDLEGICASSGSACSAGSLEPSHVVSALGGDPLSANALVRFSLGRETNQEEVDFVCSILPSVIRRSQVAQ